MYFPARDGTAAAAPARPGLGSCAGKDQTLFEKAQTERSDAPRSRCSAQGLGIHTTSRRLAPASCPCWDVLAGDSGCTLPQPFPRTAPVSHQQQTGRLGHGRRGCLETLVPLHAASWCLDGRAECVRARGAAARAPGTEGWDRRRRSQVTRSLGCCCNPGLPVCGSSLSPAGWETGNTAVQAALASFFFTPASSSLETARRPLFLNHISPHAVKRAQRDGEKRCLSKAKSRDSPGLCVAFFSVLALMPGEQVFQPARLWESPEHRTRAAWQCRSFGAQPAAPRAGQADGQTDSGLEGLRDRAGSTSFPEMAPRLETS